MPIFDDVQINEQAAAWAKQLTPEQLDRLAEYVDGLVDVVGCTHRQLAEVLFWVLGIRQSISTWWLAAHAGVASIRSLETERTVT